MKSTIQQQIDAGDISSMSQLLAIVDGYGWKITRNGANYLGLQDAFGKHFRVKFSFANDTRPVRLERLSKVKRAEHSLPQGYWIYGLFAHSEGQRACYIGQAVDYLRRTRDHVRGREGRSSWELSVWASQKKSVVRLALLDFIPGQPRTHEVAAEATVREGLWLHRAQAVGYLTPGSERWGTLPKPDRGDAFLWPADEIALVGCPLSVVLSDQPSPATIAIRSLREQYEQIVDTER